MKLLAKTAEDRYQTAAAVEHDLRRCLAEWERVEPFALGESDTPDRLMIRRSFTGGSARSSPYSPPSLDTLPLTSVGKVDKKKLREMHLRDEAA
jgi:acyl-CoA synthetase (AMP-forming)/AMP-acid ligase II